MTKQGVPANAPYWFEFCLKERMDAQVPKPKPNTNITMEMKPQKMNARVQLRPKKRGGCLAALSRASFCKVQHAVRYDARRCLPVAC